MSDFMAQYVVPPEQYVVDREMLRHEALHGLGHELIEELETMSGADPNHWLNVRLVIEKRRELSAWGQPIIHAICRLQTRVCAVEHAKIVEYTPPMRATDFYYPAVRAFRKFFGRLFRL